MTSKPINYFLIKTVRVTGWMLLVLIAVYIVTGFSLCDKLGVRSVLDTQTAQFIHQLFDWPLVAAFLVHASITVYFALRRWGWIKKRTDH